MLRWCKDVRLDQMYFTKFLRFKDLTGDDKQKLMDEFKSKFGVYVEKLKNIHSESGEQSDGDSTGDIAHSSPSYQMFFIAVLIMLLIFGSS